MGECHYEWMGEVTSHNNPRRKYESATHVKFDKRPYLSLSQMCSNSYVINRAQTEDTSRRPLAAVRTSSWQIVNSQDHESKPFGPEI